MKIKETDFLETYLRWCKEEHNATVWTEVPVAGLGTADAIICVDGYYSAIEGKAKLTYELLGQALRWVQLVSSAVAVIPYASQATESFNLAKNHYEFCGIGIHAVGDHISTVCLPKFNESNCNGIEAFLRDSQLFNGRFAKAGTSGGKRGTAANEHALAIEDYIAANPFCTAAEAAREHGMKANALLKMVKKGEVKARIATINGKSQLIPLTKWP